MKRVQSFSKILLVTIFIIQNVSAQDSTKKEFTKIHMPDHGKIILKQGSECSVRIETGKRPATVTTDISNGVLTLNSDDFVNAYVTVKDLERIDISGNGKVETDSSITTKDLELIISGIGKIEMNLEAENLKTDISGKGSIELNGSAKNMSVDISGAGKVEADNFSVSRCDVNISGAGKSEVDVKDELNINISGVGSVNYVNEPAKISQHISGLGKVGNSVSADESVTISGKSSDTTTVNIGNKKVVIIGGEDDDDDSKIEIREDDNGHEHSIIHYRHSKKTQGHWGGFELGFNNYGRTAFSPELPAGYDFLELNTGKSIAVNLNLFDWNAKIIGRNLMFVTGLGITWNNWRFQNDRTLIANAPALSANFDSIDYSKNKLTASYATLPLLLEVNSNEYEKKSFHAGVGIIFGYRIGSHTKQVYEENDKTRKVKLYDDFNLDPFRYDATLRVGFRGYTIFASYGLNRLFKKNEGPELHPFTFGLTLLNW
jgi:putative autotransporter adhesin-like protein/outer membrane protein with beta-barrel domain